MTHLWSPVDVAATLAAVGAYHAIGAIFESRLIPLPAAPFAAAGAVFVFCAVKALAAGAVYLARLRVRASSGSAHEMEKEEIR